MATHLITGAGSGIGAALADRLHARGDRLVLLARSVERAEQLAAAYDGATPVVADLADRTAIEALDLLDGLGEVVQLDGVVHAAGVVELGRVAELSTSAWVDQLTVNLVAPAVLTRLALPGLRAARGTAVFVNSGAGLFAHPQWSAYAASKHGLKALADSLRAEEAEHGVRVTSVFPGRTASPMQEKVHQQEGKAYDVRDWIRAETVADLIVSVLDLQADATMTDVSVKPTPR